MILAVDIGNTNIVIGAMEKGRILFQARLATECAKTADQYTVELKNILSLFDAAAKDFEGSIVASVVPTVQNSFRRAIMNLTGREPLTVGPGMKTGLNIRIEQPGSTGADLIAAAVGALKRYPLPMAIIDMGTATTVSVLDKTGAFIGGCICPGVGISGQALSGMTAQLPSVSLDVPRRVIGKNTVDCIQSGLMYGAAAMIDGLLQRMEEEYGETFTVVMTGGIAHAVAPLCRHANIMNDDLLLEGLWQLYTMNR